jgi:hypothetical protein
VDVALETVVLPVLFSKWEDDSAVSEIWYAVLPSGPVPLAVDVASVVFHPVPYTIAPEYNATLVLDSSMSNPLQTPVIGSWLNRPALTAALWINPLLPTNVAVDPRVNVGVGPLRAVSVLSVANWRSSESLSGFNTALPTRELDKLKSM